MFVLYAKFKGDSSSLLARRYELKWITITTILNPNYESYKRILSSLE